jgi:hypothetical protein
VHVYQAAVLAAYGGKGKCFTYLFHSCPPYILWPDVAPPWFATVQKGMDEKIARILGKVDTLTGKVDTLTDKIDTLTTKLDTLEFKMGSLTSKVEVVCRQSAVVQS